MVVRGFTSALPRQDDPFVRAIDMRVHMHIDTAMLEGIDLGAADWLLCVHACACKSARMCACARVCMCACVLMRACVRACVRACRSHPVLRCASGRPQGVAAARRQRLLTAKQPGAAGRRIPAKVAPLRWRPHKICQVENPIANRPPVQSCRP